MSLEFDWTVPRGYFFIVQSWFDDGQVFERVEGLNLTQAATLHNMLALESCDHTFGMKCLVRMVCDDDPTLLLPSIEELDAIAQGKELGRRLSICLPLPENRISARRHLRKQWASFQKVIDREPVGTEDIDFVFARRLHALSRRLLVELQCELSDRSLEFEHPQQAESISARGRSLPNEENPKLRDAVEFVRSRGPIKGQVIARHINVSISTFRTHYAKRMRQFGVVSSKAGYSYEGNLHKSRDA